MSLPTSTQNLDTTTQGLPTIYLYSTSSGPSVNTVLLDTPSQGLPAIYMYTVSGGGAPAATHISLLTLGVG